MNKQISGITDYIKRKNVRRKKWERKYVEISYDSTRSLKAITHVHNTTINLTKISNTFKILSHVMFRSPVTDFGERHSIISNDELIFDFLYKARTFAAILTAENIYSSFNAEYKMSAKILAIFREIGFPQIVINNIIRHVVDVIREDYNADAFVAIKAPIRRIHIKWVDRSSMDI